MKVVKKDKPTGDEEISMTIPEYIASFPENKSFAFKIKEYPIQVFFLLDRHFKLLNGGVTRANVEVLILNLKTGQLIQSQMGIKNNHSIINLTLTEYMAEIQKGIEICKAGPKSQEFLEKYAYWGFKTTK